MWRAAGLAFLLAGSALAEQPRIDSLTPSQGPIAGGTTVILRGAHLSAAEVRFDRTRVTPESQSDSEIRLRMPAHDNGYVVISARNESGAAYVEYLYLPPRLDEIGPGFITTVAGVGNYVRSFGPANATVVVPGGLAYDRGGNLYVTEANQHRVSRVKSDGTIEPFAGPSDEEAFDGIPAPDGNVSFPPSVGTDSRGNVYIATHGPRLMKVDGATGFISTFAGTGVPGYSGDGGLANAAKISQATHLAANDEAVYFIDWDNGRIRRVDLATNIITTYAGNGMTGYSGDGGPATAASFRFGTSDDGDLALDPAGNLFIADSANNAIRRVDKATGIITTFYTPTPGYAGQDSVGGPISITTDSDGNVYFGGSGRIVKVSPQGAFIASWGLGRYTLVEDGPITASTGFGHILGLAIDSAGNVVFSDDFFNRVRRINIAANRLETVAGIGPALWNENGSALAAPLFNDNSDLALADDGALLLADGQSGRIRRIVVGGNISTFAGGKPGNGFDNVPAAEMPFVAYGIDVTADGGIDTAGGSQLGRIDANGIFHTLGGKSPECGLTGDGGPLREAQLCQPWETARDPQGNLWIADTNNNRVRRADTAGIVSTPVGNGGPVNGLENFGHGTTCGDGGPATAACINTPYGLAFDRGGNLFISEMGGIRRVDKAGIITTFATPGPITKLVFDSAGFLYASRIAELIRYDNAGHESTIAGHGEAGFGGDGGPALQAKLRVPSQAAGIAIDAEGNVFLSDGLNRRVRAIRFGAVLAPAGASVTASANGSALRATVRDGAGNLAPGVRVDFTAPASGPTCLFPNGSTSIGVITDSNGVATVNCYANCLSGSYEVKAQPLTALAVASIQRANPGGPCRRRGAPH